MKQTDKKALEDIAREIFGRPHREVMRIEIDDLMLLGDIRLSRLAIIDNSMLDHFTGLKITLAGLNKEVEINYTLIWYDTEKEQLVVSFSIH